MCAKSDRILGAITGMLAVGLVCVLVDSPGIVRANDINRDLILASMKGDVEKIISLLDSGADINAKDHRGWTALLWPIRAGHQNVVKVLANRGAENNSEILISYSVALSDIAHPFIPMAINAFAIS